jgi:hypothetical protein
MPVRGTLLKKKVAMEILVFKTSLVNVHCIQDIEPSLDVHPDIYQWNVDLNDDDNILRIMANNIAGDEVENMLLSAGYYCEELK